MSLERAQQQGCESDLHGVMREALLARVNGVWKKTRPTRKSCAGRAVAENFRDLNDVLCRKNVFVSADGVFSLSRFVRDVRIRESAKPLDVFEDTECYRCSCPTTAVSTYVRTPVSSGLPPLDV